MRTLLLVVALLVLGILGLPAVAAVLDGTDAGESLILPVHVLLTAVVGALLGRVLAPAPDPRHRVLVGAGVGVLAALAGIAVFVLLLNGFDGA